MCVYIGRSNHTGSRKKSAERHATNVSASFTLSATTLHTCQRVDL